jgi:Domain of unknown function (DUF5666)
MHNIQRMGAVLTVVYCAATLLQACNRSAAASPDHIRGTLGSVDGNVLTVDTATGSVRVRLDDATRITAVTQSDRDHITDGSFLGITSVRGPDGSERAVEIHVFPESMRGAGEGRRDWDLPGVGGNSKMTNGTATASKMTNGTVASSRMTNGTVSAQERGSSLTLQFKDGTSNGSQTFTVPPDIPVVALEPAQLSDLKPGAQVFVLAHRSPDGVLTADRVMAGKDGVAPPM